MKTELIEAITNAEREVALEKEEAAKQAETLTAQAEEKAKTTREAGAGVCKAYAETQIRLATAKSEKLYADEIKKARAEAESEAAVAVKNADVPVSGIVKRIIDGEEAES